MKNVSAERRLELIRRIREESDQNRTIVTGREGILYEPQVQKSTETGKKYWKLRLFGAVILFLVCMWYRNTDMAIEAYDYDRVCALLQEEINMNTIDFAEEFPYTLTGMDLSEFSSNTTSAKEGFEINE